MPDTSSICVSIQHPLGSIVLETGHPVIVNLVNQLGPLLIKYGPLILEALIAAGAFGASKPDAEVK